MSQPVNGSDILVVDKVHKEYRRGFFKKEITFSLNADFRFARPAIVGVMGANGAGKTTLFEMITGSNPPTQGRIYCKGQNIHQVKYRERDRLAIHYHQSYQVRKIKWSRPNFLLESAQADYPIVHLFDEPQFNTQDGYIGFMLDFFKALRRGGKLVFISLHPTEPYHLEIITEICEEFMFVFGGKATRYPTWEAFVNDEHVRYYLGVTLEAYEKQHA